MNDLNDLFVEYNSRTKYKFTENSFQSHGGQTARSKEPGSIYNYKKPKTGQQTLV